jgi:hypothetical protein
VLWGLGEQLSLIRGRRRDSSLDDAEASAVISVNQFFSSFLAFFSFYLYGLAGNPMDLYLFGTRFAACVLTIVILREIAQGRGDLLSRSAFVVATLLFVTLSAALWLVPGLREMLRFGSTAMIVAMTFVIGQGYLHQVVLLRRNREAGAVSPRYHQLLLVKDFATCIFALTMGWSTGWPIFLLSSVSGVTKTIILWHLRPGVLNRAQLTLNSP